MRTKLFWEMRETSFWDEYAESWPKCDDCREEYWRRKIPEWYKK